jgi:hypothetical protein
MKNLKERMNNALNNECGGPNVEQIIGIGIAIAVGVALYTLANTMYNWVNTASNTVNDIQTGKPDSGFLGGAGA